MKAGIIGAGFGGLSAGYNLVKQGVDVTILESGDKPGGLAIGFRENNWKWTLEQHYHHWFTSDWSVLNLAREIGHKVVIKRPITATFIDEKIRQLDSPLSLLQFDKLSYFSRLRLGSVLAYLKISPDWKSLEKIKAKDFIVKYMGAEVWRVLWEPLFMGKFGNYVDDISAAWFWARVHKRSSSLAYPERGFLAFAENIAKQILKDKGKILYQETVNRIYPKAGKIAVITSKRENIFDIVICTLPTPQFLRITDALPTAYINSLKVLKGMGAINLVLSLKKQFLENGTYWLNIDKRVFPFLCVVEHTNFMDKNNYNNEHIIYFGNYLDHSHEYFKMKDTQIVEEFLPYLKKINPKFSADWVNKYYLFKAYFAQPIFPLGYSKILPKFETPIKGLYLTNIQQVYPWDRGTNYAIELGEKVAHIILEGS